MVLTVSSIYPKYAIVMPENKTGVERQPVFAGNSRFLDKSIQSDLFQTTKTVKDLNNSVNKINNKVNEKDTVQKALFLGGVIPTVRRLGSLPGSNPFRVGMLASMAGINISRDMEEVSKAAKEVRAIAKNIKNKDMKKLKNIFKHPTEQPPLTLVEGTWLGKFVKPGNWLDKLNKFDKTLYHSKSGQFINKLCKITEVPVKNGDKAIKFSGNYLQKLLGRTMLRVSRLSLLTTVALEVPALIMSIVKTKGTIADKADAFKKQLVKSAGYVGFVTAGIALCAAVLAPTSAIGGLIGMAIGSAIGIKASNELNKAVDKNWT